MSRRLLLSTAMLLGCCNSLCIAQPRAEHFAPRVVVVAYFEVGNDTGDRPGELQLWVERDHLDRSIAVPGMSRPVRMSADGREMAITIGPGNINPAVNLMALGSDSRFDLRKTKWLIAGIAGISALDGTIGDAVWTDFVIDGALLKSIDPREKPASWPDGFMSLDGEDPFAAKGGANWETDVRTWTGDGARANRRGNVVRLNTALMRWAFDLTRGIKLPEDAGMRKVRESYGGEGETGKGPSVRWGANIGGQTFWHGRLMDAWAHRWVAFETDGVAHLGTTAMNDTGTLLALQSLTQQSKADWNNVLLLRTASNFDMQPKGRSAADTLAEERHGAYSAYIPALDAAYLVGHRVVDAWLAGK